MRRYSAKKRQESKKKETKPKALEYTTSAGRGKNRVKAKPAKTKPKLVRTHTVLGVEYRNDTGRAFGKPGPDGIARTSNRGYSIDPKTDKRTNGHKAPAASKPKPSPNPTPSPSPAPTKTKTKTKTKPTAATSANAQNLRQGRSPDKPKAATGADAQNLRSGPTPPKNNEAKKSLQIKPKKKKLTNKQRKQGGFH